MKSIGIRGIRNFKKNEVPLAYPIRIRERDKFRTYLMNNKIYCAVHWPFDGFMPDERPNSIFNAKTLISLPIDQRYGDKEINYMLEVISKYGGELIF